MFAKFRLLVFLISILGFSLSSCQKDELYTPEGPESSLNASSDFDNRIVDPDDDDDDDDDNDDNGRLE